MSEISLGEALKLFMEKSRFASGIKAYRIEEAWPDIIGKTVAKYTKKIQLIKTTLYIYSDDASFKHTMMMQKEMIIQRVNEKLGEGTVNEVVIR